MTLQSKIVLVTLLACRAVAGEHAAENRIAVDHKNLVLSPYTWKHSGQGESSRAEATMPGAYLRAVFTGSARFGLLVDGTANHGCPAQAMPIVDFSVDGGDFHSLPLADRNEVYCLALATELDPRVRHRVEVYFRAASLGPDRWGATKVHLRVAGVALDKEGSLEPCPVRSKRAIGFGDSITEGVCAEGLCPYYSNLMMNNARVTWLPLVCAALNCEYGQLGSGGLGLMKPMSLPPLSESWDHFDAATSRLTDGRLTPEPDYVFCCIGTNDYEGEGPQRKQFNITAAYTKWLADVRKACPDTSIFCVPPPLGWHMAEVAAAVASRRNDGDVKVHLIDVTSLLDGYSDKNVATKYATDGCHPTVYGNAVLAALVAAQAEKALDEQRSKDKK